MTGPATVREASFERAVILGTCAALALSAGCTTTYVSQGRRSTDPNIVYEAAEEPPTRASGRPSHATRASAERNEGRTAPTRAPATAQLSLAEIDLPALARRWRNGAKGDLRLLPILDAAERAASAPGRQVLRTGRRLALRERKVFRGSCWSFATAVYGEAGFARKRRRRPFKSKSKGPYVDINAIQPGDFLSYINHSYNRGVHSAIFVAWLDKGRAEALMLSYVGGRRARPGGYRSYRLTDVYSIIRPRK